MFRGEEKAPEKKFDFSGKLSDKEKRDLIEIIDKSDGAGRLLYLLLNRREGKEDKREEKVERRG
jgi:hypothetical protein